MPTVGTQTAKHTKGPIKSVHAERSEVNPLTGKSERFLWYRQTYDNRGRLLETTFFKEDGSLNNTWIYLYTDDKCSEAAVYSNNSLRWREVYMYDERGVLRETKLWGPDGLSTARYVFKYDNMGRKTEWVRAETNGREYTKEYYKYDSTGRLSEEFTFGAPGLLDSRLVYSYNPKGEIGSMREYFLVT